MFNLPTLVTITAPTCAGKNHLLEAMVQNGFGRIVSTTDREPRDGEVEGLHYFFISTVQSELKEKMGLFAELVTYNGTRYGVAHEEMARKLAAGLPPPIVILEPNGLDIYRKYCASKGWTIFSIYVETQESIRLERLVDRTTNELIKTAYNRSLPPWLSIDASEFAGTVRKIVSRNNSRLKDVLSAERLWSHSNRWDAIVDGTNADKALAQIAQGVKNRNSRSDIYK